MTIGVTRCPHCDRSVTHYCGRYRLHSVIAKSGERCPMTDQRVVVTGLSEWDFELRAKLVADLAEQVQDADPQVVWTYLTALSAVEVQRLLVIALAAVPVDQTVGQMFAWVSSLPVANEVAV